jgi:hypothetical protein
MPNMISYLVKEIIEPKKEVLLRDYLLSKDAKLGEAFSFYFAHILISSIEKNIEAETSFNIINYYLHKIPIEISKKWMEMEYFNNFILILIEKSEIIKKKLLAEETISLLIDFIMGKSSPLYKGDERNENKNIKGKLGPLVRSVAYLYQYFIDNKEKDTNLKISENDEKLINYLPFYENIILEDYDEEGSSILIKLKIDSSINMDRVRELLFRKHEFIKSRQTSEQGFIDFIISLIDYMPEDRANFEKIYRNKWLNANREVIEDIMHSNENDEEKVIMELQKSDYLINKQKEFKPKKAKKFIFKKKIKNP